jgi:hypothetical protein
MTNVLNIASRANADVNVTSITQTNGTYDVHVVADKEDGFNLSNFIGGTASVSMTQGQFNSVTRIAHLGGITISCETRAKASLCEIIVNGKPDSNGPNYLQFKPNIGNGMPWLTINYQIESEDIFRKVSTQLNTTRRETDYLEANVPSHSYHSNLPRIETYTDGGHFISWGETIDVKPLEVFCWGVGPRVTTPVCTFRVEGLLSKTLETTLGSVH